MLLLSFSIRKGCVLKCHTLFSCNDQLDSKFPVVAKLPEEVPPPPLPTHLFLCAGAILIPASHSPCGPFTSPKAALPGVHGKASSEMIMVKASLVCPQEAYFPNLDHLPLRSQQSPRTRGRSVPCGAEARCWQLFGWFYTKYNVISFLF